MTGRIFWYDFSESDEAAANIDARALPRSWDEAHRMAREQMPDQGYQVQDNFAEALMRRAGRA